MISPLFCPLGQDLSGVAPRALPCLDAFRPPSPVGVGLARSKEHHSRRRTRDTIRWHSHLVRSLGSPNPRAASPWLWWLKRPEWLESHWGLQKYYGSCPAALHRSVSALATALWL